MVGCSHRIANVVSPLLRPQVTLPTTVSVAAGWPLSRWPSKVRSREAHRRKESVASEAGASPVVGVLARYQREQARLVPDAFHFEGIAESLGGMNRTVARGPLSFFT
jgi:hypothetical protein